MKLCKDPRFPHLRRHLALIKSMGVDGVSSDEELPRCSGGEVRYLTYRQHFLSDHVSNLVHAIDDVGLRSGYSAPYTRIASGDVSVGRRIVCRLPWNAYDAVWYIGLQRTEREIVAASPEKYNFSMYDTLIH